MTERDKAIIEDLIRFRCMTRDDVAELHFSNVKKPAKEANKVLLRLRLRGEIDVSKERRKYLYFPIPSIKKDSQKINHFLAILDFYKQLQKHEKPRLFEVEPKLGGKGLPEPDIFAIWRRVPLFVEVQNKVYTHLEMQTKLNRYEAYYLSRNWEKESWQPKPPHKPMFPHLWIVGKGWYTVGVRSYKVFQGSVDDYLATVQKKEG